MTNRDNRIDASVSRVYDSSQPGTMLQSGTYVGVVKRVNDPDRTGKLHVWIPELGGLESDPNNWRTVRYASPFIGVTNAYGSQANKPSEENFANNGATYGFWAVPPDINNQVLVTFINGQPDRGFWFACVMPRRGHAALPGNSGGKVGDKVDLRTLPEGKLKQAIQQAIRSGGDVFLPLTEFNPYTKDSTDIQDRKRVINEILAPQYLRQGLQHDARRGARNASSQRDMPSQVYGMSTPGRPLGRTRAPNPNQPPPAVNQREGGHSFVMDDGDVAGNGSHMKMRSAGGHQILMDDDLGSVYVINAEGSNYIEMTRTGHIFVYAQNTITMRTEADFNVHSDKKIRLHGATGIEMRTDGDFIMEGKGNFGITGGKELNLFGNNGLVVLSEKGKIVISAKSDLLLKTRTKLTIDADETINIATGEKVPIPKPAKGLSLYTKNRDTVQDQSLGYWREDKISFAKPTIVPIFVTHEPWNRGGYDPVQRGAPQDQLVGQPPVSLRSQAASSAEAISTTSSASGSSGLSAEFVQRFPGVASALQNGVASDLIPRGNSYDTTSAPDANESIGNMPKDDVTSMLIGIAYANSYGSGIPAGQDYGLRSGSGAGRYGLDAAALADVNLLKPGANLNGADALDAAGVFRTGNLNNFLKDPAAQETAAQQYAQNNYQKLVAKGVIPTNASPAHTAGMLTVANTYGADAAADWANTGTITGSKGRSPNDLYAAGSAAVASRYNERYGR